MRISIFPLLILIVLPFAFAQENPSVTVTVRGEATIFGGDMPAAREEAMIDAQRNALEQVMGVHIKSETAIQDYMLADDTILTMIAGHVKESRIIGPHEGDRLRQIADIVVGEAEQHGVDTGLDQATDDRRRNVRDVQGAGDGGETQPPVGIRRVGEIGLQQAELLAPRPGIDQAFQKL